MHLVRSLHLVRPGQFFFPMKKMDFTILNRKIAIKERSNNFLTNDRTHVNNTTIEREFHSRHRGIAFFAIENFILLIYQA